jgi:ring-1,2-phenylacetyl-CoA epoxidase subunit PaaE
VADESDDAGAAAEEDYEVVTRQVKVMLDGKTVELTVTPDQTILQSAIKAKLDPPYACEEGVCCTCRAKVHSGMVAMRENEGLSESELNAGYVLTCQAQPLSDGVVVEFC